MTKSKDRKRANKPILCVGIGASAGGFAALKRLLAGSYQADKMAFVVVQHLDSSGRELTLSLLAAASHLPVLEAQAGGVIEAGHVYVAPPQTILSLNSGAFHLKAIEDRLQGLGVIDAFFDALAADQGEKAVGVVLSGDGSDGALGLMAISNAGGMTIAQTPATAAHPSMPQTAIDGGTVDHILAPEEIPAELARYETYIANITEKHGVLEISRQITAALTKICSILQKRTRHDFKHYKTSTLVRRIQRRMQVLQLGSVTEYVERLSQHEDEIDALFKELLIKVTNFFRDPEAFQALRHDVIKPLVERPSGEKIRVWVAGCSTGEEAYSLAMLFKEELAHAKQPSPEVQIIATDIDEASLALARKGAYSLAIANDVSPERLKRFFVRSGARWRVTKELRDMCLFSSHNLINDPPFSQIDMVSCRNVLIYLGSHLQKKIIPVFHYALRSGGYLFLGTSESLSTHKELFRTLNAKLRIAQRKTTAVRSPMTLSTLSSNNHVHTLSESSRGPEVNLNLLGQRIILDEFAPKYAMVNDDYHIVSVSAGIVTYLEPSEGPFQNDIIRLVRPSLRSGLRTAFGEARRHKRKAVHDLCLLELEDGVRRRIEIVVQPMPQLGDESSLFMVVFRDLGVATHLATSASAAGAHLESSPGDAALVQQLEGELSKAREELEKTVQDLEASNEELKSSNEELLSMNEELQSANEELEASKEEVQAANDALQKANSDLENLLASTPIATLFLDENLRIRDFTPGISKLYNLRKSDIGRPIADFANTADFMPPFPDAGKVASVVSPVEHEISAAGRIFLRRMTPYKTHDGCFSGSVATFIDVTEMRKVEERFRLANDAARISIWDWNLKTDEITWGSHQDIVFGHEAGHKAVNKGEFSAYKQALHPADKDRVVDALEKALHGFEEFMLQYRVIWPDGQIRWIESRARVFLAEAGKASRVVGTHIDVTDIREASEALKEREARFRQLAEGLPQLIWTSTGDGVITYFNSKWYDYTGQGPLPEAPLGWLDAVHPDDRSRARAAWEEAIASDTHFNVELRIRRHTDGAYLWHLAKGLPMRAADGAIRQWVGVATEIHTRRLLEEELRASREHYRLIFAASPLPKLIVDLQTGRFVDVNDAAVAHYGYSKSEFASMNIIDLYPREDQGSLNDVLDSLSQQPVRHVKKSGDIIQVEICTHDIEVDGGQARLILANDVTARLKIEEEQACLRESLAKAKQWAEQASAAKTSFLANMSHEIRTPLTAIAGYAQLISYETSVNPEVNEFLDHINRNSLQLVRLIDDMLDLSKIEVGKLGIDEAPFDPAAIINDAVSVVALQARQKGLELTINWRSPPPKYVISDAHRLGQVIVNLVGNAIKFTERGRITVDALVLADYGLDTGILEIRVSDTGIGISPEQAEGIFSPFNQGDSSITRRFGGSGLGLTLSTKLVQLLNGDLKLVRSELGKGSEFLVTIEVGLDEHSSTLASTSPKGTDIAARLRLDGIKVLVVDDIADNVLIAKRLITLAGGSVVTAYSAKEALLTYAEVLPDVILMDLQMPDMDGYQTLAELRRRGYQGPVIAFTAHAMKEERERCLAAGFAAHLSKPIGRYKLVRALREHVKRDVVTSLHAETCES